MPAVPDSTSSLPFPDVLHLVHLVSVLASEKREPRPRRHEILGNLLEHLPATAGLAIYLKDVTPHAPPIVAGLVELGIRSGSRPHTALLQEFNHAPFQDLFSRAALHLFLTRTESPLTFRRVDLLPDDQWHTDPHLASHRAEMGEHDVLLSISGSTSQPAPPTDRPTELAGSEAYALMLFRIGPGHTPFTSRDAHYLHAAHSGVGWIYREESQHRANPHQALRPRLQQTLELLLTGASERQIGRALGISQHTVHDYVKALYVRFSVSSRQELIAWWARRGLPLPQKKE